MSNSDSAFGGWYSEDTFNTQWDFDTNTVTGNITLYAKWVLKDHTVTFKENGGSPVPAPQHVIGSGKIVMPPPMSNFSGNAWNFSDDTVSGNTVLYAKWVQKDHTGNFEANGGNPAPAMQHVTDNGKILIPPPMSNGESAGTGW